MNRISHWAISPSKEMGDLRGKKTTTPTSVGVEPTPSGFDRPLFYRILRFKFPSSAACILSIKGKSGDFQLCVVSVCRGDVVFSENVNIDAFDRCSVKSAVSTVKKHVGEQGWCSGESTRLPLMWPEFDSRTRRHVGLVCCYFSSLLREVFPSPQKPTPLNSSSIWKVSPISDLR